MYHQKLTLSTTYTPSHVSSGPPLCEERHFTKILLFVYIFYTSVSNKLKITIDQLFASGKFHSKIMSD